MQITHEYLKKYSYLRSNPKNIPQPAPSQNQPEKSAKNEESVNAIIISEQNEKLETEIQQPIHYDIELNAQNEQLQQEELSQSLKKTVKTTPTRRNLIFEPLIQNNPSQILNNHNSPSNKEKHLMIVQQYNMLIDLHPQPIVEKNVIQENIQQETSKKEDIQKSKEIQEVSQQLFNPFAQQKEISMYVDQSQIEQQENFQELLLNSFPNQEQEQKFLQNESMDPDYNKEDYLKIIEDYIEFIKIVEYMDKDQIEQQILKHQCITSRKKYFLIVEPLIQLMLFEQFPHNPFKKDTQTIHSSVDYVAFYEILKQYKTQLVEKDYIPNLSHFMHYQLSQQTKYFLQVKKEQIKWNPILFKELQKSRNELSILLKIYEQLQQTPLYLLDQDIDAFIVQISNMSVLNISIFHLLFSKYKKKIQIKLKQLKRTNKNSLNHSTKYNFTSYEEAKDIVYIKLQDLRDSITQHQLDTSTNFVLIPHLIKQLSEIQTLIVQVQKKEAEFIKQGISYDPLIISLEQDVTQIFSLLLIDIKGPAQKAKVLLRSRVGEFSWTNPLSQEHQELKNMTLRYSKIVEYYNQVRDQYSEELNFVRTLKFGKKLFQQNILLLTQYMFIKQELAHKEISIFSYPLTDFQQITVKSTTYETLINETNNKVIAIQQLKQYQIVETLTRILTGEDYQQVYKQLNNMKNTLISVKFSQLISEQVNIVIQYIKTALIFFPKNILQIYAQTETYQDLEEHLGDIKQFKKAKNFERIYEMFSSFFEKKVQNEFNWIFEQLIDQSNQECDYNDLSYLQNRLDILYDFNRADINNKYVRLELIEQIKDQPSLRDLINIGRGILEELTALVLEDNEIDDISYSNQRIIDKILEIECPQNVNPELQDFSSLLSYHKSLQLYPNEQQFHNSQFNLGLLVFEEYQKYLTACQQRIRQLFPCTFIKVNTLKIEALQSILFKTSNMTQFVPIGQLHQHINYCYSDVQSIMVLKNKKKIQISEINGKATHKFKQDNEVEIQVQYQNSSNIGVYIDDIMLFICE